jgi:hypothetical protein
MKGRTWSTTTANYTKMMVSLFAVYFAKNRICRWSSAEQLNQMSQIQSLLQYRFASISAGKLSPNRDLQLLTPLCIDQSSSSANGQRLIISVDAHLDAGTTLNFSRDCPDPRGSAIIFSNYIHIAFIAFIVFSILSRISDAWVFDFWNCVVISSSCVSEF